MSRRRSRVVALALRALCMALPATAVASKAPPPPTFTDHAAEFDAIEARTAGLPMPLRVAELRAMFGTIAPGLYGDTDSARLDRRIAKALAAFPSLRADYRDVVRRFPGDLAAAVDRFRISFPGFVSPLPIVLSHQLGQRDGGTDVVAGCKVMLFGADVIARLHHDDSMQPFLEHELFHLEHARHFADCDQLWCPLWQEGLATYAASVMTPGADDHQLLLDQPAPIRTATDARWGAALCWLSGRFDATDGGSTDAAFSAGASPPDLPSRFGYYVGLRIAEEAGRTHTLPALAGLDDDAARPVVAAALATLIGGSEAPCAPPASTGHVTHGSPRPA